MKEKDKTERLRDSLIDTLIAVFFLLICVLSINIYTRYFIKSKAASSNQQSDESNTRETYETVEPGSIAVRSENTLKDNFDIKNADISEVVKSLSLEKKIGQLLLIDYDLFGGSVTSSVSESIKTAITDIEPGGVVLYGQEYMTRDDIMNVTGSLSGLCIIPMFIASTEAGDGASTFTGNILLLQKTVTSMQKVGWSGSETASYNAFVSIASQMSELGFNLNLAPFVNLLFEPETSFGSMSFGMDKNITASMTKQAVLGLHDNGIADCSRDFPINSLYSVKNRTLSEWRMWELSPFKAAVDAKTDCIMISGMSAPNITNSDTPCTLSEDIISLLKNDIGYNGVIISARIGKDFADDVPGACVKALKSGCDMVFVSSDYESAYKTIIEAVRKGELAESDIDSSVKKVLEVKIKRGILKTD